MSKKTISICIPTLNEEENVYKVVDVVEGLFRNDLANYLLEIIITDNASTDRTWEVVKELSKNRPYLKGFRFSRNFSYQNSVFAGLCLANGDAIIALDADLEDPPSVIPEFVKKWEQGFDVVYGVRKKRYAPVYLKILFNLFYRFLNLFSSINIPENAGDFRLLDRRVVDILKELPERNLYLRGLVSYLGFNQAAVPYNRQPRISGKSKFRFTHYIILAFDALTALSKTPLRVIGIIGMGLFSFSLMLAAYYIISAILNPVEVKGFISIVVLLLSLHGINFIFLGIIGEYLSRIFDDAKYRPRVIISETTNVESSSKKSPPKIL